MRKFQFRLQALYDTSQQRERGLRHDLVRARGVEARLRAQMETTLATAAEWEQSIRENQRGRHDVKLLRRQLSALSQMQKTVTRQQRALRSAERAAEKVRAQLTEAARKRKSLERLREKTEREYLDACNAQEIKRSDDMAATRAVNKRIDASNDAAITGASR